MKIALVTTTINIPTLLEDYCKDICQYGHKESVFIIVVGDKKTKEGAKEFCEGLQQKYSMPIEYMGVKEQESFLEIAPFYRDFLSWNCIQRRNVGILKAYRQGADYIITIDDDNFIHTPDYIGHHLAVLSEENPYVYESSSGWYNVCSLLKEKDGKVFYHRGYSFLYRRGFGGNVHGKYQSGRIVVNAGLWLGDPDVDAVTRLAICPEVVSAPPGFLALGTRTKSPFNSQNTALHRDVIPAYCLAAGIGRYDDIMASYIVKRIADHLGDFISFGTPLVFQKRNEHDLWKDLELERTGFQLVDTFVEWLYSIELKGTTYVECVNQLVGALGLHYSEDNSLTLEQSEFLFNLYTNYVHWIKIFK